MPGYGLSQAIAQMYGAPSALDQKNTDYAKLLQMQQYYKNEADAKKVDQEKMLLFEDSIQKAADGLLGPDRNALYEAARVQRRQLREVIKANGNDISRFMANGGELRLSEYKNSILQSEQMTQYMENKKNAEFILKAMAEGKAGLISPVDKMNFDNYTQNGGGKITYSGMMSDYKVDKDQFKAGEIIPFQTILNQNKAAVLANYSLHYKGTERDPVESGQIPNDDELVTFLAGTYGVQKGTNTKNQEHYNNQLINDNNRIVTELKTPYDIAQAQATLEGTVASTNATKVNTAIAINQDERADENHSVSLMTSENKLEQSYDENGNLIKSTSSKNSEEDSIDKLAKENTYGIGSTIEHLNNSFGENSNIETMLTTLKDKKTNFGTKHGSENSTYYNQVDMYGDGYFTGHLFKGSKKFKVEGHQLNVDAGFTRNYMDYIKETYGGTLNESKNIISDLNINRNTAGVYTADGMAFNSGKLHNSVSGFSNKDYDQDQFKGAWKHGKPIVAIKANGKLVVSEKRDGKPHREAFPKGAQGRAVMVMPITNDKTGATMYVEVDFTDDNVKKNKFIKSFDTTAETNQSNSKKSLLLYNKTIKAIESGNAKVEASKIANSKVLRTTTARIFGSEHAGDKAMVASLLMALASKQGVSDISLIANDIEKYPDLIVSLLRNDFGVKDFNTIRRGSALFNKNASIQRPEIKELADAAAEYYKNYNQLRSK